MAQKHEKSTERSNDQHEMSDQELRDAKNLGNAAVEGVDADIDAILDEIDEVLEANAEDFVKAYIQKGGQ